MRRFFDERWVDAPVRPHKRGGAFCAYTVPSVHPYVLLNFTARRRDVLTMAHELGHGLHAALAQPPGRLPPVDAADPGRDRVGVRRGARVRADARRRADDDARLALLAERIDGAIATVFRQMAMNRFEHLVHTRRRSEGELSVDRISESWVESQTELFGDSVEITDGYRMWWSYIPHFINTPGYVYAYAYGQLLALSVYRRYTEEGDVVCPQLSGAAGRRRLAQPRGARRRWWTSTCRPRLLGLGAGAGRGAAERRRGAGGSVVALARVALARRLLLARTRRSGAWAPASRQASSISSASSVGSTVSRLIRTAG